LKNKDYLPEREIRQILVNFLASKGWNHELDEVINCRACIKLTRGKEKWLIQIKGNESTSTAIINSFVSVLGGILRRMDDQNCKYSIALPDTKPYRRLWERTPVLAKDRTQITALFIDQTGAIEELAR
jgi:hypothetical protein